MHLISYNSKQDQWQIYLCKHDFHPTEPLQDPLYRHQHPYARFKRLLSSYLWRRKATNVAIGCRQIKEQVLCWHVLILALLACPRFSLFHTSCPTFHSAWVERAEGRRGERPDLLQKRHRFRPSRRRGGLPTARRDRLRRSWCSRDPLRRYTGGRLWSS
jgi:hypothetical protein